MTSKRALDDDGFGLSSILTEDRWKFRRTEGSMRFGSDRRDLIFVPLLSVYA